MKNMNEYRNFLDSIKKIVGSEAFTPDEGGLASFRVDDRYNVNLQYVEGPGSVLCFVELMQLPPQTPKEVYRDLLSAGLFGKETAGGYFALELATESVVYNYMFNGDAISEDPEDFVATLEKILQLCDLWAERLTAQINGGAASADTSALSSQIIA
ncbi:MAG: type III secretion system chaperone [Succinivibrio sp.]|nr:type III secretion system chaperone [Succinivibrio sp.]